MFSFIKTSHCITNISIIMYTLLDESISAHNIPYSSVARLDVAVFHHEPSRCAHPTLPYNFITFTLPRRQCLARSIFSAFEMRTRISISCFETRMRIYFFQSRALRREWEFVLSILGFEMRTSFLWASRREQEFILFNFGLWDENVNFFL